MNSHGMNLADLERIVDFVRRDDPALTTLPLAPDGKYQTRALTLGQATREVTQALAEEFRHRVRADFPMLFCAWGKCRVGSTALNNVFGAAGLPSYYQPVKNILRHALVGAPAARWLLPSAEGYRHVFSKETGGPYVLAECLFIPLQALIEAGYPADRIHLVVLDREPSSSLASWIHKWSSRVPESRLAQNYVVAALNKQRVEDYARRHGVAVTHYVYEASKESVQSARILFEQLGLADAFTTNAVTDWNEIGQLDTGKAKIVYPQEPDVYVVPGLHGSGTAYRYRARADALSESQLALLARFGIRDVYRVSAQACARDLGLTASASARLFGMQGTHVEAEAAIA